MARRRQFLVRVATASTVAIAGCSNMSESGEDNTTTLRTIGESVIHKGLEMSVTETRTAKSFAVGDDRRYVWESNGENDVYLLTRVNVINISDRRINFPRRVDHIGLIYKNGEATDAFPTGGITVENESLTLYTDETEPNKSARRAPDTTVSGWCVFVLPEEEFTRSNVFVTIQHDSQKFRWVLE